MVQTYREHLSVRFKGLPEDSKVLQRHFPGWAVLVEKLTTPRLRAQDIRRILGLTYRQIHNWNTHKLLWFRRDSQTEWRRFSIADIFGLALVKKVAESGVPFSKLQKSFAVRMGVPGLLWNALPYLIAGQESYLYTDFENLCLLALPHSESGNKILNIPVDSMGEEPAMVLPLKPILEALAAKLDLPDFGASVNADRSYSFTISGVPLRLEDLHLKTEFEHPRRQGA